MANQMYEPFTGKLDAAASDFEPFNGTLDGQKPKGDGALRKLADVGLGLAQSAIAVPETAVGLADLATGGKAGKFLANEDGDFGFRPGQAKQMLEDWKSDGLKAKKQEFQQADGIIGKTGVALSNPSLVVDAVAQSAAPMFAGGILGRGVLAVAPRVGAVGAGAIGEGIVGAGSAAEQIRQESADGELSAKQSGLAAASGVGTALFGALGGKVASKLGIGDVDTMITQGAAKAAGQASTRSIPRQAIEGAISEGLLEELPQSVSEQIIQNLATDKPWGEGVDAAAVMGTLAGMGMGGAASGLSGFAESGRRKADAPTDQPDDAATPPPGLSPEQLAGWNEARLSELQDQEQGEQLGPQSEAPDGRAILDAQRAANRAEMSPDDEIYQSTGFDEQRRPSAFDAMSGYSQPAKPSELMGLNPSAGPLSAAAALAVDSGAFTEVTPLTQRPGIGAQRRLGEMPIIDVDARVIEDRPQSITTPRRIQGGNDVSNALPDGRAVSRPDGAVGADASGGAGVGLSDQQPGRIGRGMAGAGAATQSGAGGQQDVAGSAGGRVGGDAPLTPVRTLRDVIAQRQAQRLGLPAPTNGAVNEPSAPQAIQGQPLIQEAADPAGAGQAGTGSQAGGVSAPRSASVEANGVSGLRQITPNSPVIGKEGESNPTIVDAAGRQYRVHSQRNNLVIAHPIIDGKPQVSADTTVRFWTNPEATPSGENDRTDPIYQADAVPQAPAAPSGKRPKARQHPPTVRGSGALAEVSRALGGVSPDLLADLSEKVIRNRTSKTGKKTQYTSWDNPEIPGVGPLFRKGGTGDIAEVARVLEEAGYLEAGANERDPIGAAQRAQEIIRGELRKGGSTTQVGNADAIDAEMRARLNAEMEAAMDAESDPWDDFSFAPDDLEVSGYANLNADLQAEVERLIAEAESAGIDTETIREDVARQVGEEASQDDYNAAVKQAIQGLLPRDDRATEQAQPGRSQQGDRDGIEAVGNPGEAGDRGQGRQGGSDRQALTLEAQTEEDLRAKTDREEAATKQAAAEKAAEQERLRREAEARDNKARADATVDDFQLGQTADQQLSGMDDLFSGEQDATSPEVGPFGPILTQYKGDAQGAIKALTELQDGEAVAALSHPDVGGIDLVWGKAGTRESNGFGLAKLVQWHPEVLDDLQTVVSSLKVVERSKNRVQLESENHKASVRLEWDGQVKHWLLTAFEKRNAGGDTRTDTAANSAEGDTARSSAGNASVARQDGLPQDTPKLTRDEAKKLMEWQDMGQSGGVKTHRLFFYASQADKDAKRGRMNVASVSKDASASKWSVEGGPDFAMLGAAKKAAEEVGMARAVSDGFVQGAQQEDAPKAEPAKAEKVSAPPKPAPTESPKDDSLERIFEGLQGRGLKKKAALEAAKAHPLAERITLVDKHILDILSDLDESGTLNINC